MGEETKNWSERLDELLQEGDEGGATKLLEDVVQRMQIDPGADANRSLAVAMSDLAALYDRQHLSIKADSLRSSAIAIRHKAEQLSTRTSSIRDVEDTQPEDSTSKHEELQERQEEEEEDWEKVDYDAITRRKPSPSPPTTISRLSLEEKTPKQRGRGAFTYGSNGLYSDQNTNSNGRKSESREEESEEQPELEDSKHVVYGASHVLVLEGFSPKTTTKDLEKLLMPPYTDRDVVIRWVNDTTALAVFCNPAIAREALQSIRKPGYKLKLYDESVEIHGLVSEKDLEPPASRPVTSARAAQRMIMGALTGQGIVNGKLRHKVKFTAAELQKQEKDRKQRLLDRERLREEAWGGD